MGQAVKPPDVQINLWP